jgi:hypothetical protein
MLKFNSKYAIFFAGENMRNLQFATIESDGRMELRQQVHGLKWISESDTICVIECRDARRLRIQSERVWALERGINSDQIEVMLSEETDGIEEDEIPRLCTAPVSFQRRQKATTATIKFPHQALWWLFAPDYGPSAPKGRRESACVLVSSMESALYIWSARHLHS